MKTRMKNGSVGTACCFNAQFDTAYRIEKLQFILRRCDIENPAST